MERRLYFLAGDLLSNAGVGFLGALAAVWLAGAWHPLLAMGAGMLAGMIVAMIASLLLTPLFGGFEVMLPAHVSGMAAGMYGGMAAGPDPIGHGWHHVAHAGALIGIVTIVAVLVLNAYLQSRSDTV